MEERLGVKREVEKAEILMNAHLSYFQNDLQQAKKLGLK